MNFLFLMDPLNTVIPDKDTSFILMIGARRRNHNTYYLSNNGLFYRDGKVFFKVKEVIPQLNEDKIFIEKKSFVMPQNEADIIFVRSDPPFDNEYLMNSWILDLLSDKIPIINKPSGIRTVNEKIWISKFTSITPRTLICKDKNEILEFYKNEKNIIAKPVNSYGGQSVFYIKPKDINANVIFETLTKNWTQNIIVQKYIKEAKNGDKRILLLNGNFLGAILRVHKKGEHRNNIYAGGKAFPVKITKNDKKIIKNLAPHLKKLGLYFVGIDIIGDHIIEVNVTSPTCLQEMNRFYNVRLEDKVINYAEKLAKNKK